MATTKTSPVEIERQVEAIDAGQRIAGEEPTTGDLNAARSVLAGETSAEQAVDAGLAGLEAAFHVTR